MPRGRAGVPFDPIHAEASKLLQKAGFDDIETAGRPEGWLSTPTRQTPPTEEEVVFQNWATAALHTFRFKTQRDRLIWEGHAEGKTGRQIAAAHGFDHSKVSTRVAELETAIRTQQRRQLNRQQSMTTLVEAVSPEFLISMLKELNNE